MGPESPRITELRRRVESDPSSIAFAQLAEEYRRAGDYEAAERYCRSGLARHPAYLSARVTLGRTLIELDKLEDAEQELQHVLAAAPDNLAALRGVAEIQQRAGKLDLALEYYRRALSLSRHDPDLEELVERLSRAVAPAAPTPLPPESPLDFDELFESLGIGDRAAPPIVEALLDQSSQPVPPPPIDQTSDLAGPESSPVGSPSEADNSEPDWMTGPLPQITAPVAEEPLADPDAFVASLESFTQEISARDNETARAETDVAIEPFAPRTVLAPDVLDGLEVLSAPDALGFDERSAVEASALAREEPPESFAERVFALSELPERLGGTSSVFAREETEASFGESSSGSPELPASLGRVSSGSGLPELPAIFGAALSASGPPDLPAIFGGDFASGRPEPVVSPGENSSDSAYPEPIVSFGGTSPRAPAVSEPVAALASHAEALTAYRDTSPVDCRPEPASPDSGLDAHDSMILDELEAWLKAIQR